MFPLALLLIFAKNYLLLQMTGSTGEEEVSWMTQRIINVARGLRATCSVTPILLLTASCCAPNGAEVLCGLRSEVRGRGLKHSSATFVDLSALVQLVEEKPDTVRLTGSVLRRDIRTETPVLVSGPSMRRRFMTRLFRCCVVRSRCTISYKKKLKILLEPLVILPSGMLCLSSPFCTLLKKILSKFGNSEESVIEECAHFGDFSICTSTSNSTTVSCNCGEFKGSTLILRGV